MMSGANLDGYSSPREGIHKLEMQKRVDTLNEKVEELQERVRDLQDITYQLIEQVVSDGK
jgi:hypothetical protein